MVPIPRYRKREIRKLYEVAKDTLGDTPLRRRRAFVNILRIYHKWADRDELNRMFDVVAAQDQILLNERFATHLQTTHGKRIMKMFGSIDKDGSGGIDLEEFQTISTGCGIDAASAFQTADLDGNGILDLSEFSALIAQHAVLRRHIVRILDQSETDLTHKRARSLLMLFNDSFVSNDERRPSLVDLRRTP